MTTGQRLGCSAVLVQRCTGEDDPGKIAAGAEDGKHGLA